MSRITYDETMSSSDALIWHIEADPQLRSTIMSVWFLEKAPSAERMRATVDRMVCQIPRLRQRVVDGRPRPRWVSVDLFDLDHHYSYDDRRGAADRDDVFALAETWVREPFDRTRPLWQLAIVAGLADGKAALVLKVHHAIADGVGLMLMLAALADLEPNPRHRLALADVVPPATPQPNARRSYGAVVRHPVVSTRSAARSAASIGRLVMPTRKPLSPLMTQRCGELCLDVTTVPFATLRNAGKAVGGSLNDAFISVVLDAINRYHDCHGMSSDRIRVHMPINIRDTATADRAGNQFVPARIVMTTDDDNTKARMRRVSDHLAAVRREPALSWVNTVSAAIQRLGVPISRRIIGGMMKGVDVLASNVAGPPCPLYLAGEHVEEFYAFGPPAGAALNVTLFSYDNTVHLGVTSVAGAVESRDQFMACLAAAIADMTALAAGFSPAGQAASARAAA